MKSKRNIEIKNLLESANLAMEIGDIKTINDIYKDFFEIYKKYETSNDEIKISELKKTFYKIEKIRESTYRKYVYRFLDNLIFLSKYNKNEFFKYYNENILELENILKYANFSERKIKSIYNKIKKCFI